MIELHAKPVRGADSALAPARLAERSMGADYERYRHAVTAMLGARYRDLSADERVDLYHEAWASVLKRRSEGTAVTSLGAYLLAAADKLAAKRVYGADARRRMTFDPQDGPFLAVADAASSPEERVVADDEARRVRRMVHEMSGVEASVLKLRLELGLEPREVRDHLGLTDRQYRRAAERASKALLAQFALFDSDAWERRRRSLLSACLMGIATDRQREKARKLLAEDPYARAILGELRELGERAAALLPVPPTAAAAASGDSLGHLAELATAAKQQMSDLLSSAKHHAASLAHRATDPTPLTGARPGAVAAAVAGCIAAGGGAYCAVEGVPEPIRPPLGIEESADRSEPDAASPPEQQPPDPVSPAERVPAAAVERPPAEPPPAPAQAGPSPAPVPETEFEPTAPATPESERVGSTSARPTPATPAPAPASGTGEFSP